MVFVFQKKIVHMDIKKICIGGLILEIRSFFQLTSELANKKEGWKYKQELMSCFDSNDFWHSQAAMFPVYQKGNCNFISLNELAKAEGFIMIMKIGEYRRSDAIKEYIDNLDSAFPIISGNDLGWFSRHSRNFIFGNFKNLADVKFLPDNHLLLHWIKAEQYNENFFGADIDYGHSYYSYEFNNEFLIALGILNAGFSESLLLNRRNDFVRWLILFRDACGGEKYKLDKNQVNKPLRLLTISLYFGEGYRFSELNDYISKLRNYPDFPEELRPPDIVITPEMLGLPPDKVED